MARASASTIAAGGALWPTRRLGSSNRPRRAPVRRTPPRRRAGSLTARRSDGRPADALARADRDPIERQLDRPALGRRVDDRLGELHVLQPLEEARRARTAGADRLDELGLGQPLAPLVGRDRYLLELLALARAADVAGVGGHVDDQRSFAAMELGPVR